MSDLLLVVAAALVVLARLIWPRRAVHDSGEDIRGSRGERARGDEVRDDDPEAAASAGTNLGDVADGLVLLALALRGGRSPLDALDDVAVRLGGAVGHDLATVAAFHRWGLDAEEAWGAVPSVWAPAAAAWVAAERAGVSPGPLLDRAAASIRVRAAAEREAALQRAAVLLVLPLGLAFLPGFVLTTVAPTVWRLLPSLLGG